MRDVGTTGGSADSGISGAAIATCTAPLYFLSKPLRVIFQGSVMCGGRTCLFMIRTSHVVLYYIIS